MHAHLVHNARIIAGRNSLAPGYKIDGHGVVMLAETRVALCRSLMVVEGDAGRNHIEQRKAAMTDCCFDEWHELRFIAREAASNKGCADFNTNPNKINGRVGIDVAFLADGVGVHRGGILSLGQPIAAVVFNEIGHIQVASHDVRKLAHAD